MQLLEEGLTAFLEESDAKFKRIEEERKAAEADAEGDIFYDCYTTKEQIDEALKAEALKVDEIGTPIPLSKSDEPIKSREADDEGIDEPTVVTSDDDSDDEIFYDCVSEQETEKASEATSPEVVLVNAKVSRSVSQEDEGYVSDVEERS